GGLRRDRRAVQPHLVRAHPPAGLPACTQLRRILDRMGQLCAGSDHPGRESMTSITLPPRLAEIAEDFGELPDRDRLQLLLEFSRELPPLPDRYATAATCSSRCRSASRRCSWPPSGPRTAPFARRSH